MSAAERLTHGLVAYFLDAPQLQPLAEPAAAPHAGSSAQQGPTPDMLAFCRAEGGSTPHPLACDRTNGDPCFHGMRAMSGSLVDNMVVLEGTSQGEYAYSIQQELALHTEQRLEPGQPGVVTGDSSSCGSNERWTAHAALVLNAPAAPAHNGTQGVPDPRSLQAQSAAASAAHHAPDNGSQVPRPGLTGPGLQGGMQEPPGASREPVPCAAGSASMYIFENWAPLQRSASAFAKALCDGVLWSAFGIIITARHCLCFASNCCSMICYKCLQSASW